MVLDQDLSRRLGRLLRGERRSEDLDRLFLALRERHGAHPSVREIGDFVAHRDQREKGPVTQKARDVFTSFQSWLRISVMREPFTLADIRKVAEANLRNATDAQLEARLGLKRAVVKSVLAQALNKAEKGRDATPRERKTVDYLGGAFIWNPAFTDIEVVEDLLHVLGDTGLLQKADHAAFHTLSEFITLYVLTLMHGSAVLLENGDRADLVAGFANAEGRLEVKAVLTVNDLKKPVFAPACLFWTTLLGTAYCAPELLYDPSDWQGPLEINRDGKLAPLR
ncbi:MAG: hypothetical protein H7X93_01395 [Sphingomonadaceae bacterium]|nr:hypothetical protein [Sphingomonadaceae bacterium]